MHYLAYVLIPADGDVNEHVARVMEPHREDEDGTTGFWDGWQLGGRWTGFLSGVDPTKDPRNHEPCPLCVDTPGMRYDLVPSGKPCNGCTRSEDAELAPGIRLKWATQWAKSDGDVLAAPFDIPDDKLPHTLVLEGKVSQAELHDGMKDPNHRATVRSALAVHVGRLVIVDYHR